MQIRRALAASVSALVLTPALAATAHAAEAQPSAPAAATQQASSPVAAVTGFLQAIDKRKGTAACALLTKGYQKKFIRSAVGNDLVPAGSSCAEVAEFYGQLFAENGGLPKYQLKVLKRTDRTAKIRLTYQGEDASGTYSLTRVGSRWLISGDSAKPA